MQKPRLPEPRCLRIAPAPRCWRSCGDPGTTPMSDSGGDAVVGSAALHHANPADAIALQEMTPYLRDRFPRPPAGWSRGRAAAARVLDHFTRGWSRTCCRCAWRLRGCDAHPIREFSCEAGDARRVDDGCRGVPCRIVGVVRNDGLSHDLGAEMVRQTGPQQRLRKQFDAGRAQAENGGRLDDDGSRHAVLLRRLLRSHGPALCRATTFCQPGR